MRFNSHYFFRNIFLLAVLISSLLLTACGGGGGGGSAPAPATSNVTVTIPGSLLTQPSGNERAATDGNSDYKLKVEAYSEGKKKTDVKIDDRQLTSNGTDYTANVDGLLNAYDYRFIAFYKDTEILSNQISSSELTNGANITLNIDTSYKTLAYDAWLKKSPSNASMKNFEDNAKTAGLSKDADYSKLSLQIGNDSFTVNQYKANLLTVTKGGSAPIPTSSTAKINIDKIATTDKEKKEEQTPINNSLVGTWYLNEEDGRPVVPNNKGEVGTMVLNSDGSCSMTDYGLTDKNHSDYWETEQSEGTEKGKWKYSNNKLYVTIDGTETSFDTTISKDTLMIKGKYENSNETWVSVYKKTKYKLELYSGGSGTEIDPYIIANAKDLDNVRYSLSSHFIQTKDIDLSEFGDNYKAEFRGINGKGCVPIGGNDASDKTQHFTGSFNGNGYKITNLYINRAAPGQGLFSILGEEGVLKGINITVHSDGISGTGIMGTLVALTASSSEISDCNVINGKINGYQMTIGGLVGWSASNISNCSVECTIKVDFLDSGEEQGCVGGLVGICDGASNIIDSKVECAINSKISNVGGLIGNSKTTGYIRNCTAYGTVLCDENVNAGGLIGNNSSTVENCAAKVAVVGCYGAGGFVGINTGKISKCYSFGNVGCISSQNCGFAGGFAGTNNNQIVDCYSIAEAVVAGSENNNKTAGPVSCFVGYNQENGVINRCYATGKASCSSICSGGIVGWNKGEVRNAVALCESVLVLSGDVGRVVAMNNGVITNCYAISTMKVNSSYPSKNIGTSNINGETVTESKVQTKSWWTNTLGFNSSIWSYSSTNKRMELINMPSLE